MVVVVVVGYNRNGKHWTFEMMMRRLKSGQQIRVVLCYVCVITFKVAKCSSMLMCNQWAHLTKTWTRVVVLFCVHVPLMTRPA